MGPDESNTEMIKCTHDSIVMCLIKLLNDIFSMGFFLRSGKKVYRYLGSIFTTKLWYNLSQMNLIHGARARGVQITRCTTKLQFHHVWIRYAFLHLIQAAPTETQHRSRSCERTSDADFLPAIPPNRSFFKSSQCPRRTARQSEVPEGQAPVKTGKKPKWVRCMHAQSNESRSRCCHMMPFEEAGLETHTADFGQYKAYYLMLRQR